MFDKKSKWVEKQFCTKRLTLTMIQLAVLAARRPSLPCGFPVALGLCPSAYCFFAFAFLLFGLGFDLDFARV